MTTAIGKERRVSRDMVASNQVLRISPTRTPFWGSPRGFDASCTKVTSSPQFNQDNDVLIEAFSCAR
jgi:hypothetical protein